MTEPKANRVANDQERKLEERSRAKGPPDKDWLWLPLGRDVSLGSVWSSAECLNRLSRATNDALSLGGGGHTISMLRMSGAFNLAFGTIAPSAPLRVRIRDSGAGAWMVCRLGLTRFQSLFIAIAAVVIAICVSLTAYGAIGLGAGLVVGLVFTIYVRLMRDQHEALLKFLIETTEAVELRPADAA